MIPSRRDLLPLCALAFGLTATVAPAAEVEADLVGCRKAACHSCYDPCEPVGPIRRFFRSVFRVPCPPAAQPIMVPAAVVRTTPDCGPGSIVPALPPSIVPAAPPVDIGRPGRVMPPIDVPPPSPPAPVNGFGARPPRLTPPTPPVPVRLDRLASRGEPGPEVTLVHATRSGLRLTALPDRDGSLTRDLTPGEWLVYTPGPDGKLAYRGKVMSREGAAVRITLD
jgi:hypothetical protein